MTNLKRLIIDQEEQGELIRGCLNNIENLISLLFSDTNSLGIATLISIVIRLDANEKYLFVNCKE